MNYDSKTIETIVRKVIGGLNTDQVPGGKIPVGVSSRHIHLSNEHIDILFGKGYQLTKLKDLSQIGQYACNETVTIIGPSMRPIEKVRVLGPARKDTQIEISRTDSFTLKIKPPVRPSGEITGTPGLTVIGPKGTVVLEKGSIIANRHIHMSKQEANEFGVKDNDLVTVDTFGERKTRFYDVQIRVDKDFRLEMHIDTDDANAAGICNQSFVEIVK